MISGDDGERRRLSTRYLTRGRLQAQGIAESRAAGTAALNQVNFGLSVNMELEAIRHFPTIDPIRRFVRWLHQFDDPSLWLHCFPA